MRDIWDNPTEQNIGALPLDVREAIAKELEFFAPHIGQDITAHIDHRWLPTLRDQRVINHYFIYRFQYGTYPASLHITMHIEASDSVLSSTKDTEQ